jgi:hypothetical protein
MNIPNLTDLDFDDISLLHGYYSLGIIKKYRPDIEIVPMRLSRNDQWQHADLNHSLLYDIIQTLLANGKTVFVVPFDEYVMNDDNYNFPETLNKFINDPVYFVTEMDQEQSLYWKFQKNLKCKILELPFILVNDAICYYKIKESAEQIPSKSEHNFLCMVNRTEKSKYDLLKKIHQLGLHKYGLVTYRGVDAPEFVKENFVFNPHGPMDPCNLPTRNRQEAGQVYVNNILVSSNVLNYVHIHNTYDVPLIINPESTVGIFPATEKSMWPALLGKMYLIYGHQHIMQWPDRFSSYGPGNFCNLLFDQIEGYNDKSHELRLEKMLLDNEYLIKHAKEIYKEHRAGLEENRDNFVFNLYDFFRNQVETSESM